MCDNLEQSMGSRPRASTAAGMTGFILRKTRGCLFKMTMKNDIRKVISGFYPLIDSSLTVDISPYQLAEQVLASGVSVLQLRQKQLSESAFLKIAQELAYLKIHNQFCFIINHFVDVAHQVGADGVHLTGQSISISQARQIMGDGAIIGVSVHSVSEGIQKASEGADYLTFGSIYPTTSKSPDYPAQGIAALTELVNSVSIPVVAIGGINSSNVDEVMKAGAAAYSGLSLLSEL